MNAHRINGLGYVKHPCAEADTLHREIAAYLAFVETVREYRPTFLRGTAFDRLTVVERIRACGGM